LQQLKLEVIPTDTNFIYFSLRNFSKDYFELLRQKQISGTRIYEENGSWTRITIGTKQEMEQFIQAIS
jgi:histidinol-phosphate aminotransferase